MCGRFSLSASWSELCARYVLHVDIPKEWGARYNIAPTQKTLTLAHSGRDLEASMRIWGLIPHWSKDKNIGPRLINARAETLAEKPSFKSSFRQRRCLIPADGFFEWKRDDGVKQPFRITTEDQAIFSFAGLWDSWREGISGATIETFTIITTPANSLVSEIHDRMPAILKKEDEARWLDPAITAPKALLPLLYPYPSEKMRMFPVSSVVNSWKNDTPECIEPVR